MGNRIAKGAKGAKSAKVRVTGASNYEHSTEGVVKAVRQRWAGKEAVRIVAGAVGSREVAIPVSDPSRK